MEERHGRLWFLSETLAKIGYLRDKRHVVVSWGNVDGFPAVTNLPHTEFRVTVYIRHLVSSLSFMFISCSIAAK